MLSLIQQSRILLILDLILKIIKPSTLFTTYFSTLKNEIVYNPTTFLNENIDNSEKYGLEFKQIINPTKNISFGLSYNFVKAKIGKNSQGLINGKDMPGGTKTNCGN